MSVPPPHSIITFSFSASVPSSTIFSQTLSSQHSTIMTEHWRMELNNYLQANGGTRLLKWETYSSGPPHQIQWTAVAYIRGVEYARCVGSKQGPTMENAARQTLQALYSDRSRYY